MPADDYAATAEEAHRPPARPGPAINLYEDHNGENNRRRAIPVESEDEDRDLQLWGELRQKRNQRRK